ncbi:MAG: 3-phosphoshikimate 1-carboxyvinyltransferase, partial [Sulfurovaceae bacterium]|nr:3-phosphoshikimate 1-carboxyvinyltransferase [Sulfurovaceae bacterium]
MKIVHISKHSKSFNLECNNIAPDKSISHRCAILSLISNKPSIIRNFLLGEDTLASLSIAEQLGAIIVKDGANITITPPNKISEPDNILDCGNAGTGMRLYTGLLSGFDGLFILTGDKYLKARPMKRVVSPLKDIGAQIDGREHGNLAPLSIRGGKLKPFRYHSPIDSAQVKSAL